MRGDEEKMFDELLRKSLEYYEVPPAPGVWTGIKHKLFLRQAWQSILFKGNAGLIGSISTGIVITGLTVWYFTGNMNNTSTAMDAGSTIQASVIADNSVSKPEQSQTTGDYSFTKTSEVQAVEDPANTPTLSSAESEINSGSPAANSDINLTKGTGSPVSQMAGNPTTFVNRKTSESPLNEASRLNKVQPFYSLSFMSGRYSDNLIASGNGYFVNPYTLSSLGKDEMLNLLRSDLRSKYEYVRPAVTLSVGFSVSNQWLTSAGDNALPASVLNPNAFFRLKRDRFILETGIGISRESAYLTRDTRYRPLIGTYNNLDSVSFAYDTLNGTEIPTYHYHAVSIYDSVDHLSRGRSDVTYIYASIPVSAGYSFNFKRHSLVLKSGLIFSFLLNKSGYVSPFAASDNIITATNESGFRKSNSLKWTLEASYEYMLHEKASLFFGPVYSSFIGNPFRSVQVLPKRNDYFGLKTGFIWNF